MESKECRVAVIKSFQPLPSLLHLLKDYSQNAFVRFCVFMLDMSAELIKSAHPDRQILREDKLHIVGVTDGVVESLGLTQVSLMGHPLRMDVVPDNFPISQE